MESLPVVAVSDINALITSDGVRIDDGCWVNGVLPLFLHLGMHHKERIVRQVDRNLTLSICSLRLFVTFRPTTIIIVASNNPADSELPCHAETQASDDCSRTEIG